MVWKNRPPRGPTESAPAGCLERLFGLFNHVCSCWLRFAPQQYIPLLLGGIILTAPETEKLSWAESIENDSGLAIGDGREC